MNVILFYISFIILWYFVILAGRLKFFYFLDSLVTRVINKLIILGF